MQTVMLFACKGQGLLVSGSAIPRLRSQEHLCHRSSCAALCRETSRELRYSLQQGSRVLEGWSVVECPRATGECRPLQEFHLGLSCSALEEPAADGTEAVRARLVHRRAWGRGCLKSAGYRSRQPRGRVCARPTCAAGGCHGSGLQRQALGPGGRQGQGPLRRPGPQRPEGPRWARTLAERRPPRRGQCRAAWWGVQRRRQRPLRVRGPIHNMLIRMAIIAPVKARCAAPPFPL
mmetsp:Transcript_101363/g.282123  ORF Transcript_101363/g.282123 Transcript_101363/m.282123 type:complete len:234 (-) Transcript_101363:312-1013(-)